MPTKLFIIGMGRFGQLLQTLCHGHFNIQGIDINHPDYPTIDILAKETKPCDIILAVPIRALENILKQLKTYLKPGYPIVKEDIYAYWTSAPWAGDTWYPISSIEFKENEGSTFASDNFFNSRKSINLTNLVNKSEFDFKPFRMTNTIGLQRIEYPE